MQKKTLFSLILSAFLVVICCHNYRRQPSMFTESYKKKSRAEQVLECAKCHPQEYAMEQLGPHANAFSKVKEYVFQRAQTSPHFPQVYVKWITANFNTICARCHTGENLYENSFRASLENKDLDWILQHHGSEISSLPLARSDTAGWHTGIDCLTCHVANDRVITNLSTTADPGAPCRPVGNAFFSSDNNCISCHFNVVTGMADNIHNPAVTKSQSCVSCHFEYDAYNRTTHYMYWRHDPPQKQRAEVRSGIFDDFIVAVKKENEHRGVLSIHWANKSAPHRFTDVEDIMAVVSLTDDNSMVILTDTSRVNYKSINDADIIKEFFLDGIVPGSPVGYTFLPTDSALRKNIPFTLPVSAKSLTVFVTGLIKSQYWIDDAAAEKVYERKQVVESL